MTMHHSWNKKTDVGEKEEPDHHGYIEIEQINKFWTKNTDS